MPIWAWFGGREGVQGFIPIYPAVIAIQCSLCLISSVAAATAAAQRCCEGGLVTNMPYCRRVNRDAAWLHEESVGCAARCVPGLTVHR